mmetsp:Transcript_1689/g.4898  ORF Transcript_1689/g.4898 Transcript_1689/m.4898 type:complete len:348 (+) Transcript_1689:342-1385(+)
MPVTVPARRRPKSAPLAPSVLNRCNACNGLLSLGLLILFWRLWSAGDAVVPMSEDKEMLEKLDSALIDEMEWPRHTRDQGAACAAVATYGPAGSNATRALILRRGAADWGPTGRVSLDKLVKMYPELIGTVTISPTPVFTLFTNSTQQQYADAHLKASEVPAKLENMPIKRFKQLLRPGRRRAAARLYYDREFYYWSGQPPTHLGHHPDRVPLSCLLRPTAAKGEALFITTPRLRVTAKDSVHVLHYDNSPSLLVQLRGRKLVTLIPADQMEWTYPYPREHLLYRRSKIDMLKPDYKQYPLSQKLRPTEVVMDEGDVLIFPMFTPHQTRTLTDNVNMSFRFKNQIRW